jgi:hypothetical protein
MYANLSDNDNDNLFSLSVDTRYADIYFVGSMGVGSVAP